MIMWQYVKYGYIGIWSSRSANDFKSMFEKDKSSLINRFPLGTNNQLHLKKYFYIFVQFQAMKWVEFITVSLLLTTTTKYNMNRLGSAWQIINEVKLEKRKSILGQTCAMPQCTLGSLLVDLIREELHSWALTQSNSIGKRKAERQRERLKEIHNDSATLKQR